LLLLAREILDEFYHLLGDVFFNVSPIVLNSVSQIIIDLVLAILHLLYFGQCFSYSGHELSTQNDAFTSPLIGLHTTDRHCEDQLSVWSSLTPIHN